jgi:hypothetical protein
LTKKKKKNYLREVNEAKGNFFRIITAVKIFKNWLHVEAHAYKPSTWEARTEQEDHQFKALLCYTVKLCLKKTKQNKNPNKLA